MKIRTVASFLSLVAVAFASAPLPRLQPQGTAMQLLVDGRPFLILGGELGNSSGEPDYLRAFWPKLKAMNLNTVVAPAYWNLLEPQEGRFDFAMIDGLVRDARANDLHLVLLWFGSWKNSMSCYVPDWVKRDSARFPRARDLTGRAEEILSPFSTVNCDTDARAFAALLGHLKAADPTHVVLLVQVENEIGMIPAARDHSAAADAAFAGAVPTELLAYLMAHADTLAPELRERWLAAGAKHAGTWTEVFGPGAAAEEIFMAWHFATYTQAVAAAGKAELPLPMYANAALIRPGYQPGQYPSAGPLPHLLDVWRAGAPALDFLAPDIYFPNFVEWTRRFVRGGNPLFIPESLRSPEAAAHVLYAVGAYGAIGFSPFGIESIPEATGVLLASSYEALRGMAPLIAEHRGRGTMNGFYPENFENKEPQQVRMGDWILHASFERSAPPALADGVIIPVGAGPAGAAVLPAGGLVIQLAPDEFVFAGLGLTVTFASMTTGEQTGILSVEEGRYVDGQWQHVRWLDGDQTHQGRHLRLEPGHLTIQRIRLYRYH